MYHPWRRRPGSRRLVSPMLLRCAVFMLGMAFGIPIATAQGFPSGDPCAGPSDPCASQQSWAGYWDTVEGVEDFNYWYDLDIQVDWVMLDLTGGRFHVEGTLNSEGFVGADVVSLDVSLAGDPHDVTVSLCDFRQVKRFEGTQGSCLEFFEVDLNTDRFRAWGNHTMDPTDWMDYATSKPGDVLVSVGMTTAPADLNEVDNCGEPTIEVWVGSHSIEANHNQGTLTFISPGSPGGIGGELILPPASFPAVPIDQTMWDGFATPGVVLVAFKQLDETIFASVANAGGVVLDVDDEEPCSNLVTVGVPQGFEVASMELFLLDSNVDSISPNFFMVETGHLVPDDPGYVGFQTTYLGPWPRDAAGNVTMVLGTIDMEVAWHQPTTFTPTIAIIDSGVDLGHMDFAGGRFYINPITGLSGRDFVSTGSQPQDTDGHGTMVAGIAAANTHFAGTPGGTMDIAGVATPSTIMALRVFRDLPQLDPLACIQNPLNCGGWRTWHKAVRFARRNGANVINMSIGIPLTIPGLEEFYRKTQFHKRLKEQVRIAYRRNNCYLAASSGNDGEYGAGSRPIYPARHGQVEAVGGTFHDTPTDFGWWPGSNRGPALVAPADNMRSLNLTVLGGGITLPASGTSFASPHVAGVASQMWAVNPNLTNFEIREEIRRATEPMNGIGRDDRTGAGFLNAARAVRPAPAVPTSTTVQIVTVPGYLPSQFAGQSRVKRFLALSTGEGVPRTDVPLGLPRKRGIEVAAGNIDPLDALDEIVIGGSPGNRTDVMIIQPDAVGTNFTTFDAFPAANTRIRVAVGDVTGGPTPEVIVAQAEGGTNLVRVYGGITPTTATLLWSFTPFGTTTLTNEGVYVAAGNIDGAGHDELIVGSGRGDATARRVEVYDCSVPPSPFVEGAVPPPGWPPFTRRLDDAVGFDPFALNRLGVPALENPFATTAGVVVAAGDTDGDGWDEIIVGAGRGSAPEVRVFSLEFASGPPPLPFGPGLTRVSRFNAHDPLRWSGVRVAAGDIDSDGVDEIIASSDRGSGVHVRAFEQNGDRLTTRFTALQPRYQGGVRIAVGNFPP
ncbi:MAG: S8 family serine peptidase [Planctomycetota bacterium]|nr:S8 family serine peptidase [Planctomycetota bacterium]